MNNRCNKDQLDQSFLINFNQEQIMQIRQIAKTLQMSASAFIRQSCVRNLDIVRNVELPRLHKRNILENEWR